MMPFFLCSLSFHLSILNCLLNQIQGPQKGFELGEIGKGIPEGPKPL